MSLGFQELAAFLQDGHGIILVQISRTEGSTPRDNDAYLLVKPNEIAGTIGGGQLEFHAIDIARNMIASSEACRQLDMALGPHLGQCCGGKVSLNFISVTPEISRELLKKAEKAAYLLPMIAIFGAGHTGKALCHQMALLPFAVRLIDDRHIALSAIGANVTQLHSSDPEEFVSATPDIAAVIVLTHSHSLDYAITAAALKRDDIAYVGMIGSATKRTLFSRWFLQSGGTNTQLDKLKCPIGGAEIVDKRPEIIAALTIAEIIRVLSLA